jgi:WD repeat-containing protein 61
MNINREHLFQGHRGALYAISEAGTGAVITAGSEGLITRWEMESRGNESNTSGGKQEGIALAQVPGPVFVLLGEKEREGTAGIRIVVGQQKGVRWLKHLVEHGKEDDRGAVELGASLALESAPYALCRVGNWLAIGLGSGEVLLLEEETRAVISRVQLGPVGRPVRTITLLAEGPSLVCGTAEGDIAVLNLPGLEIITQWKGHTGACFGLLLEKEGRGQTVLSVGMDARLNRWEIASGALLMGVPAHHRGIHAIVESPDGRLLATGSIDRTIKIWKGDTLELLKVCDQARNGGHSGSVNALLWTTGMDVWQANSGHLVSCSDDRTLSSWAVTET